MTGPRLDDAIMSLLESRGPGTTICPSEVARAVGTAETWRELMEPVRRAAAELAAAGRVEATQRGQVVDVRTARGPVRIRRAQSRQQDEAAGTLANRASR